MSFSWAMSLFGIQQVAGLFTPRAAKAFEEVGQAMEAELDGTLRAAFQAGDRWQRNLVDRTLGAGAGSSVRSPAPEPPPVAQPAAEPAISPDYPFAPHFVEVLGSRMHYIEQGTGDPILLLHGNPTWSYIWRNIIPHLSPLGRCIAPDLIGYGRSDKPRIEYRWVDHVRYLEGFIQAMGLRDITLVLHDQGSSLGFHYAMRHESNVKAIAFFEAFVRPFPWEQFSTPEFREMFRLFRTGGVGGEGWQMLVEQNMFIEQLLPQAAGRPLTEQEMSYYREPFRDPASRVPVWRFPRETPIGGEPPDVWQAVASYSERLQSSRLPKLMLYATPGALLTAEHVAWSQQNIRHLESVHLGAGSHFLQESSPHRIGQEVAAWLRRLRGADARAGAPAGAPGDDGSADAQDAQAVQDLVDRAAHFNMFSMPDRSACTPAILAPGSSHNVIGIRVHEVLHRFGLVGQAPTSRSPLTARKGIGEAVARFTHRWMLMPPGFVSSPDREPPPTSLDPSCSQRFVMLDGLCLFGQGENGFRSFGTGQTFPATINGQRQLLATAVGIITEGFGQFRGHEEGTFVYCGTLSPERGFMGNMLLRVMDPQGTFRAESALPAPEAGPDPEPETSYLIFRGQAVATDPVLPKLGADRQPTGLIVHQGMRLLDTDFALTRSNRLQSSAKYGKWIGRVTADVTFDPTSARGTIQHPVPFTSLDEFVFNGEDERRMDSFTADSSEGRVFNTQLGGRAGIRFGGIGRILSGTGSFAGIEGLMTDNSVVVFAPHVSASVYVLRIHDPRGKFRVETK